MDNEKILHEKNETLRIVGMYSFLFYVVACIAIIIKGTDMCFLIFTVVMISISVLIFFVVALIFIHSTAEKM
ncbi:hypothetical protein FACS189462_1240 [Spirochaetia bacterium]|nr:hypothetical protein FACS189462_1240 [Spirochaetia bacterium]